MSTDEERLYLKLTFFSSSTTIARNEFLAVVPLDVLLAKLDTSLATSEGEKCRNSKK